jgi:hypothetical protein
MAFQKELYGMVLFIYNLFNFLFHRACPAATFRHGKNPEPIEAYPLQSLIEYESSIIYSD